MTSVYLLRQPAHTISRALFSPEIHDWTVIAVEQALSDGSSSRTAQVLTAGSSVAAIEQSFLSYNDLLEVVLKAGKVITL